MWVVNSDYDETRAYALSKLANVLHTKELARRLKVRMIIIKDKHTHAAWWLSI